MFSYLFRVYSLRDEEEHDADGDDAVEGDAEVGREGFLAVHRGRLLVTVQRLDLKRGRSLLNGKCLSLSIVF